MFVGQSGGGSAVPQTLDDGHGFPNLPESLLQDVAVDLRLHGKNAGRVSGVPVQIPDQSVQFVSGREPLLLSARRMLAVRVVRHIALLLQ